MPTADPLDPTRRLLAQLTHTTTTTRLHGHRAWTLTTAWANRGYPTPTNSTSTGGGGTSDPTATHALKPHHHTQALHEKLATTITRTLTQLATLDHLLTGITTHLDHATQVTCSVPDCNDPVLILETDHTPWHTCDPCTAYHRRSGQWPTAETIDNRNRKRNQRQQSRDNHPTGKRPSH